MLRETFAGLRICRILASGVLSAFCGLVGLDLLPIVIVSQKVFRAGGASCVEGSVGAVVGRCSARRTGSILLSGSESVDMYDS